MHNLSSSSRRFVLIISNHPLFAQGIRRLLEQRQDAGGLSITIAPGIQEAVHTLESIHPDLVIIDHDGDKASQDEFLTSFSAGEKQLRIVLLSLKENGSQAVIYDRRRSEAANIDVWFDEWDDLRPGAGLDLAGA